VFCERIRWRVGSLERAREVVALAESKNGMARQFAHESVQVGEAIVRAAVEGDAEAFDLAAEELQQSHVTLESAEEKLQQDAARGGDDAHAARESAHGARLVPDGGHVTLESFCFTKASRRKITEAIRCEARLCVFNSIQVRWWIGAEGITFKCTGADHHHHHDLLHIATPTFVL